MFVSSSIRKCYFYVVALVAGTVFVSSQALASSCQVYPSEYAYQRNSVYRSERSSANCRPYARDLSDLPSVFTENYTHCDGTQLRLTDSDLGSVQYSSSDYYLWNAGSSAQQLLFIFPTRVNLTTITLHYYSDNVRGLPRLRFLVVPDDFDIWDAPSASYSHVKIAAVPPGGEPAGRRNVSVNFNFNRTKKILMYKFSSPLLFALSEVEFFSCYSTSTTTGTPDTPTTTILQQTPTTTRGNASDTISTATAQIVTTREFLDTSMEESSASSAGSVHLREVTAWLLIVMLVLLLNEVFTIDDSVTGVYNKQANATDTSGHTSQYKTVQLAQ